MGPSNLAKIIPSKTKSKLEKLNKSGITFENLKNVAGLELVDIKLTAPDQMICV